MSRKIIKAQFNENCIAGLHLSTTTAALFSAYNKATCIEVTGDGINIQPGPGKSVFFNTHSLKGPGYSMSTVPMDYMPGLSNFTPRKTFDLAFIKELAEVTIVAGAFASIGEFL